ncbi:MAG: CoA activase [Spirochaetales bacterium]|nr:CoA activase [Spirochaetales bacterium]
MEQELWVGLDVGSTTVKIAVVEPATNELLHADYQRHNADQGGVVEALLRQAHQIWPDRPFRLTFCGSAGEPFSRLTGAFFVQEVVANTIAVKLLHPQTKVAIELGGQDAKVVFFRVDERTKKLVASDMRMNGSCAGGTGAFVDQIAELLQVKAEDFNALAAQGKTVYDISGRCGVFAKTDIQPLLNQGVSKADIALSSFHAIAKQTIGGLAQGMDINPPILFEGGPLTFNPVLIKVFQSRLNLLDHQIVVPDRPEIIVALGAALAGSTLYGDKPIAYRGLASLEGFKEGRLRLDAEVRRNAPKFFNDVGEKSSFLERYKKDTWVPTPPQPGKKVRAFLGVDGGSTTTKFILMAEDGTILDKFYKNNFGDPLQVLQTALLEMRDKYLEAGSDIEVLACGTTGYAENLFATALKADFHTVETVAHAEAARWVRPDATFILDIGGQDMKAIFLNQGVVTGIVLNEACSAGCGSFVETYAKSLKVPVEKISDLAFSSENPSFLGSRCTVFMNSSIITEQKSGKTTEDILAGLTRSVIENVFTKVIRVSNLDLLGTVVVVQGGTFKNDAVLRAFEQYLGRQVYRPELPGEMGAMGIARLTHQHAQAQKSETGEFSTSFIGWEALQNFRYETKPGSICPFCANACNRTIVTFPDGSTYVTGNRCEKGEVVGDPKDPAIREKIRSATKRIDDVPDLMKLHREVLLKDYPVKVVGKPTSLTIGIPRSLEFWSSMPFWKGTFQSLGIKVKVSRKSSYEIFEKGLPNVPSDTACFPAKLAHGHVRDLIDQGVDRIFMPMMIKIPVENEKTKAGVMCPLVQGYPAVIDASDEPTARFGVPFDHPAFHWYDDTHKERQVVRYLNDVLGIPTSAAKLAFQEGVRCQTSAYAEIQEAGRRVLTELEGTNRWAIVLSGRPYHSDELINHSLSSHFTRMGIPILTIDSLPEIHDEDVALSRMDAANAFHTRMIGAAFHVAKNPNLELVQIVSFGCGHDAIISDEMVRILREKSSKELLVLKLDEGENRGPLAIRVKSFVETIRNKRERGLPVLNAYKLLSDPYPVKFQPKDKSRLSILVPNMSVAFSKVIGAVMETEGYKTHHLRLADQEAIALGKKFVHNDICYPAQINIGEILRVLKSGEVDPNAAAAGLPKNCADCRAGQYFLLARKALDEAGFPQVPLITTGADTKQMHPGFKLSPLFQIRMIWALAMIDALEFMLRAVRPYEKIVGETDKVFELCLEEVTAAIHKGVKNAKLVMKKAVERFNSVESDRSVRRPRVGVLGEVLMNFHPVANGQIERYLEAHGMEVIQPTLTDFFRKDFVEILFKAKRDLLQHKFLFSTLANVAESAFVAVGETFQNILKDFKYYRTHFDINDLARNIQGMIDETYESGEGWLMMGEILQLAKEGVNSFVVLNPFGCMPNHITGRGMIKPLKKRLPHVQILALDYDPDTSFANIENRLQMLVITARELEKLAREAEAPQETAESL